MKGKYKVYKQLRSGAYEPIAPAYLQIIKDNIQKTWQHHQIGNKLKTLTNIGSLEATLWYYYHATPGEPL